MMEDFKIEQMYKNHQYQNIIDIYNANSKSTDQYLNLYAGLVFTKMGYASEALQCLLKIDCNKFKNHSGRIYRYMGLSNYMINNYEMAKSYFEKGEKQDDKESGLWRRLLFPSFYEVRETEKIIFRFVNECTSLNRMSFIMRSLKVYDEINNFLAGKYKNKKIDVYIYSQRNDSIGNTLSYANNGLKTIHINVNDMIGHELSHIMFNSLYKGMNRKRFIDEGIAMFFGEISSLEAYINKYRRQLKMYSVMAIWDIAMDRGTAVILPAADRTVALLFLLRCEADGERPGDSLRGDGEL